MRALRLFVTALAVLLTSMAGAMDLPKTKASDYGLRGPIRQCTEQTAYAGEGTVPDRSFTKTYSFSLIGQLLEERSHWPPTPDYVVTYTYDSAGRLVKVSSGNEGPSASEKRDTIYTYDDKGQLLSVGSGADIWDLRFELDAGGRKIRVDQWPVRPQAPNTAVGSITWENSELHFAPTSGGTITTVYDEHDRPVRAEIRDAAGQVMMRIDRKYDDNGRVLSDNLTPEDMQSAVPEELAGKLNDVKKKAMAKFIGNAFGSGETTYRYDAQGRVVEKHIVSGGEGDTLTTITYNDHGDVSLETSVKTESPISAGNEFRIDNDGNIVPASESTIPKPSRADTSYTYEYDAHGNWTTKTMSVRRDAGEFKTSMVVNRTLQHY